ncbi:MAG: MBL fold metallo-hydrolase [Anaerolineae bacterium]
MPGPDWLTFFQRTFPSANMALVHGPRPILVDTGFGSDLAETEALLRDAGAAPQSLALVVNTHYHSDHVGGNWGLQTRYGLPIATHRWEAAMVNTRDRDTCGAEWHDQPVQPYTITQALAEGDTLDTGRVTLQVIHTPGHTLGHISLYQGEERVLLVGDAVHDDDVGWINTMREGAGALERGLDALDRLAALRPRWACSGHGAPMEHPLRAIDDARRRYDSWLSAPEKVAWHGCKRIFAYQLMLRQGIAEADVAPYLLGCLWYQDFTRHIFEATPEDFIEPFLAEMVRSRAATWHNGRLVALTPHNPPPPGWAVGPTRPRDWPPPTAFHPQGT